MGTLNDRDPSPNHRPAGRRSAAAPAAAPGSADGLGLRRDVAAAAARAWVESLERRQLLTAAVAGQGVIDGGRTDVPLLSAADVGAAYGAALAATVSPAAAPAAAPAGAAGADEGEVVYLPPQHSLVNVGAGGGLLSGPLHGKPLEAALSFLADHAADLGVSAADLADPIVTDQYTDADTGVTHVYLRQRANGLEVSNANLSISLTADNRVITAAGGFVPGLSGPAAAAALPSPAHPGRGAVQAVRDVAADLGLSLGTQAPRVVRSLAGGTALQTVLSAPSASLDEIPAGLHYVATADGVKLAWNVVLRTPDGDHWYDASVDAATGQLVANSDWVDHAAAYDVYPMPTEQPNDGPRAVVTDPQDPTASPFGWHDTDGVAGAEFTDTRGNNVSAQEDANADDAGGFRPSGGAGLTFDFPLDLAQAPSAYQSAAVTNLFYWTNVLHDVHARYGFTEAAGNFQVKNYGGQGLGNDAVQADAQDGSGTNNANFYTPPDGQPGRMQMYLFNKTTPGRDGDLDGQIIVHEYGHGVSNRLTGGPANASALTATQSGGMGEGWGDWWGLMFTQKPADAQSAKYPIGTYVQGQPDTGAGIRRYPYSFDLTADPLTFAAYNSDSTKEVHNTGEIWCSALWDLNWLLINKYGYSPTIAGGYDPAVAGKNGGNNLALKLVMDGLKLQPANPSFTQARDAILAADQALTGGANQLEVWQAFARRGLGYSAATTSATATTVTTATDLPPGLLNPRVTASAPTGTQTAPVDHVDFTFSKAIDPASFTVADDVAAFTGPGGANLKGQVTGAAWSNGNTALRLTFAPQSADGQYALTVGPQVLAASDGKPMDQDADGTAGEATQDQYTAKFGYDSLVMQVASTVPAAGSLVTLPMTTLDVKFNEPFDPATVAATDLTVSQGTVTAAAAVDATTVRYTLSGLNAEGTLTATIAAGAMTDVGGNPMAAYSGTYSLDAGTVAFPTPVPARGAAGAGVFDGTTSAAIGSAADVDGFTINLDAGQTLTAIVDPTAAGAGLQSTLELRNPSGAVVATAAAPAAGKDALLQTAPVSAAGTYTVAVGSAGGTTGAYALELVLNAAAEAEQHDQPANDTPAAAQDLDGSFVQYNPSLAVGRWAALGSTNNPQGASTVYQADFESGDGGFVVSNGTGGLWHLSTGRGSQAGHTATHSFYFGTGEGSDGGGTYGTGAIAAGTLTSPSISLPAGANLALDFNYVLKTEGSTSWDLSQLQVSTDGGTTFTTLASYNGVAESTTWRAATQVNLTPYAGKAVKLRWSFNTIDNGSNSFEGWYVDDVRVQAVTSASDYYAFPLSAGHSATVALKSLTAGGSVDFKLLDAAGTQLAVTAGGTTNVDRAVADFKAPADGRYYVQVTGASGTDYALVVTRNAGFDLEANDSTAAAQPWQSWNTNREQFAAGAIASGNVDVYKVTEDQPGGGIIVAATSTPYDAAGEPANAFNPRLRLLNAAGTQLAVDDNSAPDGRNAKFQYTVPSAGTYYVEVSSSTAAATAGDYVLTVAGTSPFPGPFAVASTAPAAGASFKAAGPTTIAVTFNDALYLPSVQASDLTLDGVPATAVSVTSPAGSAVSTATFTVPAVTAAGPHTFAIAAGAVADLQQAPVAAFSGTFTIDATPPRVVATSIAEGDVRAPGTLAYTVTFNEPMLSANLDSSDFTLKGLLRNVTYSPTSYGYDGSKTALAITYGTVLPEDNYTLTLLGGDGRFEDAAGNDLDGEPTWPLPAGGSGNGTEGGNFVVNFAVDATTAAFPTPLAVQNPPGGLVYTGTATGALTSAADADNFTLNVDAGQTLTVTAGGSGTGGAALRPTVDVLNAGGTVLATATAAAAGQEAVAQTVALPSAGTYTVRLSGAGGTTGTYSAQAYLNAAVEAEEHGGPADDAPAAAQGLDAAFVALNARGAARAAVAGKTPATTGTPVAADFYAFTLAAGQAVTAAVAKQGGTTVPTVSLYDAAGTVIAAGAAGWTNLDSAVANFVAPAAGTYYAGVTGGTPAAAYQLVVTRGAALDAEANDSLAAAQDIDPSGAVLGTVFGNDDYYRFTATAGDALTVSTATPGDGAGEFVNTLNPRLELYDANNALVAANDNGAADGRNALLSYAVPATGFYRVRVAASSGSGEYVLTVAGGTAAAIPGAPDLVAAADSGVSATDNNTNFNNATPAKAPQFVVPNTVAGATVTLYVGGSPVAGAVAPGPTTTIALDGAAKLFDGTYSVTARQTVPGRDESPDSLPLSVTIDTAAPAKPGAPDLQSGSDSGASSADDLTNVKTPAFTVAASPYFRFYQAGTKLSGDYGTGTTYAVAAPLSDGAYPFTVSAVDAAGNESPPSVPLTVTVDTAPPTSGGLAAPAVATAGGTTYSFAVTYADGAAVDVATLDGGDVIVTGPNGFSQLAAFVSADATTSGTPRTATYKITAPGGAWDAADNGSYTVSLQSSQVKDAAGNAAAAAALGTFAVAVTGVPAAPDLLAAADSGASSTDDVTNFNNAATAKALQFAVAGTTAGATVTVYADGQPVGTAVAAGNTTAVTTSGTAALADGPHAITARQAPAGGGPETADSPALTITVDTAAPAAPASAPDLQPASDSGVSNADDLTNVTTPTLGVAAGGAPYFRVYRGGAIASAAYATGTTFTSAALADGTYAFAATAVDAAGNESAAGPALAVTVDATPPGGAGPGGAFDPTFNGTGKRITTVGSGSDYAYDVAFQPDGKIVVVGAYQATANLTPSYAAVARYNADGTADATFGTNGLLKMTLGPTDGFALAVAVQPDGKIVLGGRANANGTSYPQDFAAARLNPDGTLDPTFGTGGRVVTNVAGFDESHDMVLQPDGKIVLAGDAADNMAAVRYNPNGTLDTSFGAGGIRVVHFGSYSYANAVALAPDGKIVLGGRARATPSGDDDFASARLTANGSLDPTFSGDGLATAALGTSYDTGFAAAVQPDGRVLVAGYVQSSAAPWGVVRFAADGNLDPTFDGDGKSTLAVGTGVTGTPSAVLVRADGRITVGGTAVGPAGYSDFTLVRYAPDGSLDPSFGTAGVAFAPIVTSTDGLHEMAYQPDGRIVAVGYAVNSSEDFAVARILDGPLADRAVPDLQAASDTGTSSSDNVTATTAPAFDVGLAAGSGAAYYRLYRGGALVSGPYATGPFTSAPLADGTYAFTAAAVDAAGNASTPSTAVAVTVDTAAPTVAASTPPAVAAGAASATFTVTFADNAAVDASTLDAADVSVTGPGGAPLAVALSSVDVNTNGAPRTATYAITPPGGSWDPGDNGAYAIALAANQVRDTAGNAAPAAPLGTFAVTLNGVPAAPDLLAAADSGASTADNVTNFNNATPAKALQFLVGNTFAGAAVTVYADGAPIGAAAGAAGSTVVTTSGAAALADGPHSFTARQTPAGGAPSADSPALSVTIDATAPAAPPAPDLAPAADSGLSSADDVTNVAAGLAFSVSATEAGAVHLERDGSGGTGPAVAAAGAGTLSVADPAQLADGPHAFTAWAEDAAGNRSADSPALAVTVDTVAPPAPAAPDLQDASDTGVSSADNLTRAPAPVFDVAGGPYSRVYRAGVLVSGLYATGPFTSAALADGTYPFTAVAVDAAGNASAAGPAAVVTIDTKPAGGGAGGAPDTTFGAGGSVTTTFGTGAAEAAAAVVALPDGRVVAAGKAGGAFGLARYRADGTPDPTFGTGGVVRTSFLIGTDAAAAVVAQPDGKVIAGGQSSTSGGTAYATLARYNVDGGLDPTFGTAGKVTLPRSGAAFLYSVNVMARQADGKVVVAGSATGATAGPFGVARLNADGSLDPTFGTGGIVTFGFGSTFALPSGLVIQPDGRIVAEGFASATGVPQTFGVARLNADGSLDPTFGAGGKALTTPVPLSQVQAKAVALQPDGKIVAAGSGANPSAGWSDGILIRYNADGSLDPTFGTNGIAVLSTTSANDSFAAVAVQPDGKIVTAGSGQVSGVAQVVVSRLTPAGAFDPTFGTNGVVTGPAGQYTSGAAAVTLTPDGGLVAAGSTAPAFSSPGSFFLAKYTTGLATAATALDPASDAGASNSDRVTNVTAPAFTVAHPDPYFRVYRNGVLVGGPYQSGTAFTAAGQPAGTWTYAATAVDAAGNETAAGPAVTLTIDTAPPAVAASTLPAVVAGAAASTFTVTFADDLAVDAATLAGGVAVAGPGGATLPVALVSVDAAGNGTPRTATYQASAPGGAWDGADDGTYAVSLVAGQVRDVAGNALPAGSLGSFQVALAPAPVVQSVRVNDGAAQRSMVTGLTVTFDRAVALDAGAFAVAGRNGAGAGAGAGTATAWANPSGDGRTWVLTFAGGPVRGGSLADGVYDLTVAAAAVHAAPGLSADPAAAVPAAMSADYTFAFHRLFSDADGDGDSDNLDLFQLRPTLLKPSTDPAYRWWFDYDAGGTVDNLDAFQIRSRRGVTFQGY